MLVTSPPTKRSGTVATAVRSANRRGQGERCGRVDIGDAVGCCVVLNVMLGSLLPAPRGDLAATNLLVPGVSYIRMALGTRRAVPQNYRAPEERKCSILACWLARDSVPLSA